MSSKTARVAIAVNITPLNHTGSHDHGDGASSYRWADKLIFLLFFLFFFFFLGGGGVGCYEKTVRHGLLLHVIGTRAIFHVAMFWQTLESSYSLSD